MIKNTEQYKVGLWAEYVAEATDLDTYGTQSITNTGALGAFTGATASGLGAATYDIDIATNGTPHALTIVVAGTENWDAIAALIQASLRTATSSTETVVVTGGVIKVTSALPGSTSSILITAGSTGSGGGDLLAAITALSADYTATVSPAIPGTEGSITFQVTTPSNAKIFSHVVSVKSSTGDGKGPFNSTYDVASGFITVSDIAGGANLVAGDIIIVQGVMYK